MALNENPMFSPMMILERMSCSLEQLKKVIVEVGEEKIIDQEIMKKKTQKMNKKYIQLTSLLDDETKQNQLLREEVETLKNALERQELINSKLEGESMEIVEINRKLLKWKDIEWQKFKEWAKARLKAYHRKLKNPDKIRVESLAPQVSKGKKK